MNSTLLSFKPASLVYLSSDVLPLVELGDYLKREGVFNPLPVLNPPPRTNILRLAGLKESKVEIKNLEVESKEDLYEEL